MADDVLRAVRRDDSGVRERGQDRCAEALDLQRPRRLAAEARPRAPSGETSANGSVTREQHGRARERRERPRPRRIDQASASGTSTSGHSFAATAAPSSAQPETMPPAQQRTSARGGEQCRPEVEAREDQRADEQRRRARRRTPPAGRSDATTATSATPHSAISHAKRRRVVAVQPGRQDEDGQRTGRILDREVAVRDEAVAHRRAPYCEIGRPVDDLAVRPEPRVHEAPRDEEEPGRRERGCGAISERGRSARLGSSSSTSAVAASARRAARRRARSRRRGRTTGDRGTNQCVSTSSKPTSTAPVSAASRSGERRRGNQASASEPTTSSTCRTRCTRCRSGMPFAWYCRQSQSENGESRPIWKLTVRS